MKQLRRQKYILVLNAGSATLKYKLFANAAGRPVVAGGEVERIGLSDSFINTDGLTKKIRANTFRQALYSVLQLLKAQRPDIEIIGHRVVHGGETFTKPTFVSPSVWQRINRFSTLAPFHNPINLRIIKLCWSLLPQAKNFAVFDTALYTSLSPEAYLYAVPYEWYDRQRVRRYGFHGISHAYVAAEAAKRVRTPLSRLNLITAHLGNGCSVTAWQRGKPIATSMGFTPQEGLVMGRRSGNIDPALPLIMQKKLGISASQMAEVFNKKSGLLGLTGFTSDMREVLRAAGKPVTDYRGRYSFSRRQCQRARLALDVFIYHLRGYLLWYGGLVGGADAIVFTGGIGERSATIRRLATRRLGLAKRPRVLAVATDEERAIVQQMKKTI